MIAASEQLDRARAFLAGIPGAAERAMARALNAAATAGRTEAVRAIGERYAAKPSDVAGMITLSTAAPDRLDVAIRARSGALSLGYFPHTPTEPGTGGPGKPVLTAEILRGHSKGVGGAFIANLSSGPRVMARTGGLTASGKPAIRSLYTIPLAAMLGVESVRDAVEARAVAVLDEHLEREIDRELDRSAS